MRSCPKCGASYPDSAEFCASDGTALAPAQAEDGQDPRVGTLVDRYRLVSRLGEGGMGVVYLAEHTIIGRQVALKLLHPHLTTVSEAVDRFFREARAAGEIATDNIVQITDSGRAEDGTNFLVMELLQGESLASIIDRERWLGPRRAAVLGVQIAAGLKAAHDRGVIHRDLKPPNVQIVPVNGTEQVKLLDFGVAKITESNTKLTQTGMIVGSPAYMSPEQASGKKVDRRTDIYAFGVILYEMLIGDTPFTGSNATEILLAHVMQQPPPPRTRRPDIPEPLESLILHCLAKEPDERPADMGEVSQRLQAFVDVAPLDTTEPSLTRAERSQSVVMTSGPGATDPLAATCATPSVAAAAPSALAAAPPAVATPPTVATPPSAPALPPTIATSPGAPAPAQAAVPTSVTPAPPRRGLLVVALLGVLMVAAGGVVAALLLRGETEEGPASAAATPAKTAEAATETGAEAGAPAGADATVVAAPGSDSAGAPAAAPDAATVAAAPTPAAEERPAGRTHRRRTRPRKQKPDGHDDRGDEPVKARHEPDKGGEEPRAATEKPEEKPKKRANVVVRTIPSGAAVVREGRKIGNTPLSIPVPRRQRLVISRPGFRSRTVDIGPKSPAELRLKLERIGDPHKSLSRLEADYRARRISILRYNLRKARLEHRRNAELARAKARYDRGELKWKQYMKLRDRIYDSYR